MITIHQQTTARRVFFYTAIFCVIVGIILGTVAPALLGVATDFAGLRHDGYLQLANMLAQGEGFRFEAGGPPVMHRPPLYPALLIPLTYLPIAAQKMLVIALNSVLAGISCTFLYKLSLRLYAKPTVGWVAIGLYLVSPWLWRLITLPHTALLQSTLYLAVVYCMVIMVFGRGKHRVLSQQAFQRHAIGFGALSGLLSLTHGIGFLIFAACAFALLLTALLPHPDELRKGKRALSILLASLLGSAFIAPWTLRNINTFPITIPVTTGASFNYFMGNLYWGLGDHEVDKSKSHQDNALIAGGVDVPAHEAMQYWGVMNPEHEQMLSENMKAHALENPGIVIHKSVLALAENFFPAVHQLICHQRQMVSCERETWYTSAHRYGISIYYGFIIFFALISVLKRRTTGAIALFLFALGGLHIGPFLPLGQWAPHGIYALSAILLIMTLAADGIVGGRIDTQTEHIDI